jgi:hypothetical protein
MEQMRGCDTAIVQIDANVLPRVAEPRIPADVLIEIGARHGALRAQFRFAGRGLGGAALSLQAPLWWRRAQHAGDDGAPTRLQRVHLAQPERCIARTRARDRAGVAS